MKIANVQIDERQAVRRAATVLEAHAKQIMERWEGTPPKKYGRDHEHDTEVALSCERVARALRRGVR
jgi:hypothetical protein